MSDEPVIKKIKKPRAVRKRKDSEEDSSGSDNDTGAAAEAT